MLLLNNPAVNLETRRRLLALLRSGSIDERTMALVVRVLNKTQPRSHGGWVYLLAESLGALRATALRAGSAAEMLCAAIDLVDDVEDGDATGYLPDVPAAVHINLAAHLWVLAALFTAQLGADTRDDGTLTQTVLALSSQMACGQHMELTRPEWSTDAYERMSELTSGRQFEIYFRLATFPANADMSLFLPICSAIGLLVQVQCDEAQKDTRLSALPQDEVRALRERQKKALRTAVRMVPDSARSVVQALAQVVGVPIDE